ncbi:hypothetical protein M9458_030605, partial [Cirrhinus mrigala]
ELMLAQVLHDSLFPQHLDLSLFLLCENNRPSSAVLIFCGRSEEEVVPYDSMSLTAANAEQWVCSDKDPMQSSSELSELIHVLTKAVEDPGLNWLAPEEPACSLLDEWNLQMGCHQQSFCQRRPCSSWRFTTNSAGCGASPLLEEVICPLSALGLNAHPIHLSPAGPPLCQQARLIQWLA